jgi:hypothetical protein
MTPQQRDTLYATIGWIDRYRAWRTIRRAEGASTSRKEFDAFEAERKLSPHYRESVKHFKMVAALLQRAR